MAILASVSMVCLPLHGQIRNRMQVRTDIYLKYAGGRMEQYNPGNIILADSIYTYGVQKNDARYKALALSLEMPVRYVNGEMERVSAIASEMKTLYSQDKRITDFYYVTMYDYCNIQILAGNISDAMLEARDMSSRAITARKPIGQMYAHRIIGSIQAYRTNSELAVRSFKKAVDYCIKAKEEQELPSIYILISHELIKLHRYDEAEEYCSKAKEYEDFYPSIRVKSAMAECYLFYSKSDFNSFTESFTRLENDPLYRVQTDADTRNIMDVYWHLSCSEYSDALAHASAIVSERTRFELQSEVYAKMGDYSNAYGYLASLMETKDSILIKVQNEDMAILDAELDNARLRLEAQKLKSQNETVIMLGFIFLFLLVSASIMITQWILNTNLDNLRQKNKEVLAARESYRRSLDTKELEIDMRIRLLQNERK